MKFPESKKGADKLCLSEIIALVGILIGLVTVIVMYSVVYSAIDFDSEGKLVLSEGVSALLMVLSIAAPAVTLIAYVFQIAGAVRCSKDEELFRVALYAILAAVAVSVGGIFVALFSSNEAASSALEMITNVTNLAASLFIIQGFRNLALKCGNADIEKSGKNLFTFVIVVYVFLIVSPVVTMILSNFAAAVSIIVNAVTVVMEIVMYVLYLIYLFKARKMLAQS